MPVAVIRIMESKVWKFLHGGLTINSNAPFHYSAVKTAVIVTNYFLWYDHKLKRSVERMREATQVLNHGLDATNEVNRLPLSSTRTWEQWNKELDHDSSYQWSNR